MKVEKDHRGGWLNGNISYAEMLRTMKEGITPEDMEVKVKKIHQTTSGALRMVVTETTTGAKDIMMKKIKDILHEDAKVTSSSSLMRGIVVMDIERDITMDEVKERLAEELQNSIEDIIANDFRSPFRGRKMITVKLPNSAAALAIDKRWIKLGWTNCRIKEKLEPSFCTRCQTYGHTSRMCQAQDATTNDV